MRYGFAKTGPAVAMKIVISRAVFISVAFDVSHLQVNCAYDSDVAMSKKRRSGGPISAAPVGRLRVRTEGQNLYLLFAQGHGLRGSARSGAQSAQLRAAFEGTAVKGKTRTQSDRNGCVHNRRLALTNPELPEGQRTACRGPARRSKRWQSTADE